MQVRIKKLHKDAVIPQYAKHGDAGMDLTCTEISYENGILTCHAGIAVEIPYGYVGLIFSRSSIYKANLIQSNCVGVIDSGYRGELMCKFRIADINQPLGGYNVGDRFAQLIIIPYPNIEYVEVDELSESERGEGGYGSSNPVPEEAGVAIDFVLRGIDKFNDAYPDNKFEYEFNPHDQEQLLTAMKLFHEHIKTVEK